MGYNLNNIRDEKTRGNKSENQFKDVCGDIKKMLGHLANCMEKNCQTKRHNSNVVASSLPVFKLSEMLLFMFFLSLTCLKLYQVLGVLWISSDRDDQMGAKIESKTIPRASDCSEHPQKLPT